MRIFERLGNEKHLFGCGHTGKLPYTVKVLGVWCEITDTPLCKECVERDFKGRCVLSRVCDQPTLQKGEVILRVSSESGCPASTPACKQPLKQIARGRMLL
jgi:hypothetical protein